MKLRFLTLISFSALALACSSEDVRPPAVNPVADTSVDGEVFYPDLRPNDDVEETGDTTVVDSADTSFADTADAADTADTADTDSADAADMGPPATCFNMTKDGTETATDCGGALCPKCENTKDCLVDTDCVSGKCTLTGSARICSAPTCMDLVQNGTETDVDCGGGSCGACAALKKCAFSTDCQSGVCTGLRCQAPTCEDGVRNGVETDVDCGGTACSRKCNLGQSCATTNDCLTRNCVAGKCECPAGMVRVNVAGGGGTFCIDQVEVTNSQYSAFLGTGPSELVQPAQCLWNTTFTPSIDWPPAPEKVGFPVRGVDWCDARKYCEAQGKVLCNKVGGGSVPVDKYNDNTVSKWHQACSQGTNQYPYGSSYNATACNGADRWAAIDGGVPGPWAVISGVSYTNTSCYGGLAANVYQLSGNVAEWEDSCSASVGAGDTCLVRGGHYSSNSDALKCGAKRELPRNYADADVGFRCCL